MIEIKITDNEAQQRLDRFLRKYLKEYTLGDIYKILRKNKVKVNNKRVKENHMLETGDVVLLYIEHKENEAVQPQLPAQQVSAYIQHKALEVVYEDDNLLLINKPIGLLTHPDKPGDADTVIDRALYYLSKHQNGVEYSPTFKPSVCNRLDRNTGGIVIVAKNYSTLKSVNEMIRERHIKKLYICIAKGIISKDGELKGYLVKNEADNIVRVTHLEEKDGKPIHTVYKVITCNNEYSLMEIELITGRSHQIRAHFASMGHPLIGDTKYGDEKVNQHFRVKYKLKHQFLYAYSIEFNNCSNDLKYLDGKRIVSKLPKDMDFITRDLFGQEGRFYEQRTREKASKHN